jgi:hypothetical protein
MSLVNTGFHMRKNVFENYPYLGHAPTKIFASRIFGQTFQSARGAHNSRAATDEDWQPENKQDLFWTSGSNGQKINFTLSCALNV